MKNLIILVLLIFFITSCSNKKEAQKSAGKQYTCPMHPQVVKDEMGECPICHMDLVLVNKAVTDTALHKKSRMDTMAEGERSHTNTILPNEIELTGEQIRLANIVTDTFGGAQAFGQRVLAGTVVLNENEIAAVSSRISGRIEQLYYKNNGDYVSKGAPLYSLYSQELNSAKQEYVLLLKRKTSMGKTIIDYNQLVQAARHKLILWGMSDAQIKGLEKVGRPSYVTTFYSSAAGYIKELNAVEGAYVLEGQPIVRLANTSTVWVEAQVFASQLSQISRNSSVTVKLPQLENKEIKGKIEFYSPEINTQSRIHIIRVKIPNEGNRIRPGMVAYLYLDNIAQNGYNLPSDAVIHNNKYAHVWIKTGDNKFKMQKVITGIENGGTVAVASGLQVGDKVVVSGAYLLNSEYLLRNGLSTMEDSK